MTASSKLEVHTKLTKDRPYANPDHPGNKLRPRVRCVGCGTRGCITAWGPWCFDCNVKRIDRISGVLASEIERHETAAALGRSALSEEHR